MFHWFGKKKVGGERLHKDSDECLEHFKKILSQGVGIFSCSDTISLNQQLVQKLSLIDPYYAYRCPMACFTDIPIKFSSTHSDKYGACALGFKRKWVEDIGGQPVMYRTAKTMDKLIHQLIQLRQDLSNPSITFTPEQKSLIFDFTSEVLFFCKDINHQDGELYGNYIEREWRVVWQPGSHGAYLPFTENDIDYIVLPKFKGENFKQRFKSNPEINGFFSQGIPQIIEVPLK